jgi:type I restriction enzyme S subunit
MALEACCIGRGVAAARHKSGSRSYTYYAMTFLRPHFDRFEAEGTVFGSVSKEGFENISVVAPSPEIVDQFENIVGPMDQLIETNEQQSFSLAELRDTLLPRLISGELRISEEVLHDRGLP